MPEAAAMAITLMMAGRIYDRIGPTPLMIPGLLGLCYSMWKLHGLDVTTSDVDLIKILFLRGASIGLMAMPAFTLVFGVHAPEAVARAAALTNVLRQIVPAFGIALFATLLQTRTAFHYSNIAQTITPDSLVAVQVLSRLKEAAGQFGASEALTNQAAIQVLDRLVQQRATVNAFHDVFLIGAGIVLLALIPSLLLRKPKPKGEAIAANAAEPAD